MNLQGAVPGVRGARPSNLAREVERGRVFDNMVHAFTDSYAETYANVQFPELVELAIKHFNKNAKKKDRIFGPPCLQSMCSFFESGIYPSHQEHYVHLNFSVDKATNTSTTSLFFVELIKSVKDETKPGTWTVLSCHPLDSGLNGKAVGSTEGRRGSRKRKRLESCFACEDDIKHPRGGYTAGHFVGYTYG